MALHAEVASTKTNFDVKANLSDNRAIGLWRLLKGYRKRYLGAMVMLGLSSLASTISLLLLRYVIDGLLNTGEQPANFITLLGLTALAFILIATSQGVFSFLSGTWSGIAAEGVAVRLRDFMFDHLQHLSFSYHDKMQTGELIQRSTSDIFAIHQFFSPQAVGIGRIIMLFIVNFTALLYLNVQLALFTVIVVPIVFVTSLLFFHRIGKAYERFQEQDERVSTALQENLSGVRVVKAFARQSYEIDRFEVENKEKYRLGLAQTKLHSMFWPITDVLTGYQMLAGYILGGLLVMTGDGNLFTVGSIQIPGITIGTFIAYVAIVGRVIYPLRGLGRLIVQMTTGFVSYNRLVEVFNETWEVLGRDDSPPIKDVKGDIVVRNLNFRYEQGPQVLHDINIEVKAGQSIALLGSTGSGKTSLLSLLTRFYDYGEGSITLDGVELTDYPKHFLRETVGVVEQEPFLFSTSIRENITYGVHRDVSDEDVIRAAKAAAVHDVIEEFPEGYATKVGERGVTLSGGQKQRVALARTLLKNPKILILDDATSSVDTETESEIRDALNSLMENRTTFIIAHRIQSVMNADQILVFDKGRIIERGNHDDLMQLEGIYYQTYNMQAQIEADLEKEIADV